MQQKKLITLNKNDLEKAKNFVNLGMPKNLARTLIYLSRVNECYSFDIEQGTHLKQPEVSTAIRELNKRQWVTKKSIRTEKKGRPRYLYKSTAHLSEIFEKFEQEKLQELENTKNLISELKNMIQNK